jgi:hypothetical protein
MTAIRNGAAFWSRETLGIELAAGVDEVSLALVADAWSRTYRSRALTFAPSIAARESRNGLQIIPDQVRSSWLPATRLTAIDRPPARALDEALQAIGARTARARLISSRCNSNTRSARIALVASPRYTPVRLP